MYDHSTSFPYTVDAIQRSGVLTGIPTLLREFGVPLERVVEGLSIPQVVFTDPNSHLSYREASILIERCTELSGCPHFGVLLGSRFDHRALAVAGAWMAQAPDLGSALSGFVLLQYFNSRGASAYLHPMGDKVIFGYGIYERQAVARDQIYSLALLVALNAIRQITRRDDRLVAVHLPIRQPEDVGPFVRAFRAPLLFNQLEAGLVFDQIALGDPINPGEPVPFDIWLRRALNNAPVPIGIWKARVLHALRPLMLLGQGRAPAVAAHLGISTRSLNRYLEREGTTFQTLLDEIRFTTACELLALTDLSIAEVSDALLFANHSALVGAFHRWSGMTPTEWRRRGRKTKMGRPGTV
ncbi:MAG: AraC family transcriptional regulator ligand-binding domain-containing protein [Rhodobacterales bacterium]|nr:AraC family transcriptional regulator ligand-binding domain-containing protein [Rhodobacterales bacterium]